MRRDLNRAASRSFRGIKPLLQRAGSSPFRRALFGLAVLLASATGVHAADVPQPNVLIDIADTYPSINPNNPSVKSQYPVPGPP